MRRRDPGGLPRRLARVSGALGWRAGHVRRRAVERAVRGLLRLALRARLLRRVPRRAVAMLEGMLLGAAGRPQFDAALYLERNPDVCAAGVSPLVHYLRHGWAEGRSPNAWLDDPVYRRQAGLSPDDRLSSLAHYHLLGRARGLGPAPWSAPVAAVTQPDDPAVIAGLLDRLGRARLPAGPAAVDVIVPVYKGRAETLACLASVLEAGTETGYHLVVVDDLGPDTALRADLAALAGRGLVRLVVQPQNLGFVAAVNSGMAGRGGRDVVWLNADTEVWHGWLDRLRRAAHSAPDIATVTPLTNNGTICSYPRFNADNCAPLEVPWAEIDRIAAAVNPGATVEAPTCVGFCTYVRGDALDALGGLDEAAFGRGYGEENDFSQRAIAAGWRNLIAGDVFVRHLGQTSFGAARAGLVAAAMRVIERRHPGYRRAVERFIAADPVAPMRQAIDLERLRRRSGPALRRRGVLLVGHSLGGGTRQHVEEEAARLRAEGVAVVLLSGGAAGPSTVRLSHPAVADLPSLEALPLAGPGLASALHRLGIDEAHVHHLADFGRDGAERFTWVLDALDLPYDFVVHDYLPICPRINLADHAGMYCGEPDAAGCNRCLARRRSAYGAPEIRRWRRDYGRLLVGACRVRVPDRDVAGRLLRHFPQLATIEVRAHERLRPASPALPPDGPAGRPLRVSTIGAIGPIKGFDVLIGLAGESRRAGGPLALTVIGYTRNDAAARAAGIAVTGPYRNEDLPELIAAADPDLILIPSTWPETYCYTLSRAFESGRPVAGFDIGAIGTRLRDAGAAPGALIPLALARDPAALAGRLQQVAATARMAAAAPAAMSRAVGA